jgi:hypothetical protein
VIRDNDANDMVPSITGGSITLNKGQTGGGISLSESDISLTDVIISNNRATAYSQIGIHSLLT